MSDWVSKQERDYGDGFDDDNWDDLTPEEQYQASDECPDCDGCGAVVVGFDDDWDVYENIEATCPRCKGDGHYHPPVAI